MSLDAAHGAVDGVKALAKQAMQADATKEEVMEAIRELIIFARAGGISSFDCPERKSFKLDMPVKT